MWSWSGLDAAVCGESGGGDGDACGLGAVPRDDNRGRCWSGYDDPDRLTVEGTGTSSTKPCFVLGAPVPVWCADRGVVCGAARRQMRRRVDVGVTPLSGSGTEQADWSTGAKRCRCVGGGSDTVAQRERCVRSQRSGVAQMTSVPTPPSLLLPHFLAEVLSLPVEG